MANFNWDDLRILLAIDRAGTFVGAGRQLGLSHTTVARRLAAAEAALRANLFHRHGQSLLRSEIAEEVLTHAQRVEEEILSFAAATTGADARLEGEVRITAPLMLLISFLAPHLPDFAQVHPGISVTLLGDLSLNALLDGTIDIGLRISRPVSDRLDIRRLCGCRFALYGAPHLAAEAESAIATGDLAVMPYLQLIGQEFPMPETLWLDNLFKGQQPVLRAGTSPVLVAAAQAGLGLTALPRFVGDSSDGLVRVRGQTDGPNENLYLVTRRQQRGMARVRALVAFIDRIARHERASFEGGADLPAPLPL